VSVTLSLLLSLTLGYLHGMAKNKNAAATSLARKSVRARRKKWGEKEFLRRMRKWGKLGGRPPKKGKRDAD
jgi:hypothetical protein